ncbi:MAG: DUF3078 domain-containing protein [Bacteroidales bacterium]|nr:DUF3078 domain-containing protein [Bacteroidales bacterium]
MKRVLLTLAIAAMSFAAIAQTDDVAKDVATLAKDSKKEAVVDSAKVWKLSGMLSLNASQTKLTNWAAGGDQQIGFNALASLNANYLKGKHSWQNAAIMQYGALRLIDENDEFRKTDDKFQISSKYGYAVSKKFYASAIFDYKSQLAVGYTYDDKNNTKELNSEWWSPLYLTYTIGIDYQPNENLTFYLSPLCGKTTIVTNDYLSSIGAFGVDTLKHSRSEFGWYFKMNALYTFGKNISLNTNLTLFNNYEDGIVDEIDVDWNVIISLQLKKWLAFNITTELIYDEDILIDESYSKTQFKDVIGCGLTFKF